MAKITGRGVPQRGVEPGNVPKTSSKTSYSAAGFKKTGGDGIGTKGTKGTAHSMPKGKHSRKMGKH